MTTTVAREWARVVRVAADRARRTVKKIETLEIGAIVAMMANSAVGMALFPAAIGSAAGVWGMAGGILPEFAEPLALRRHRHRVAKELGLQYTAAPRLSLGKSLITSLKMTAKSVAALPPLLLGKGPKGEHHFARATAPTVDKAAPCQPRQSRGT